EVSAFGDWLGQLECIAREENVCWFTEFAGEKEFPLSEGSPDLAGFIAVAGEFAHLADRSHFILSGKSSATFTNKHNHNVTFTNVITKVFQQGRRTRNKMLL